MITLLNDILNKSLKSLMKLTQKRDQLFFIIFSLCIYRSKFSFFLDIPVYIIYY